MRIKKTKTPHPYPLPLRGEGPERDFSHKGRGFGRNFSHKGRGVQKKFPTRGESLEGISPTKGRGKFHSGESLERIFHKGRGSVRKSYLKHLVKASIYRPKKASKKSPKGDFLVTSDE
jgi:hypothetical protein